MRSGGSGCGGAPGPVGRRVRRRVLAVDAHADDVACRDVRAHHAAAFVRGQQDARTRPACARRRDAEAVERAPGRPNRRARHRPAAAARDDPGARAPSGRRPSGSASRRTTASRPVCQRYSSAAFSGRHSHQPVFFGLASGSRKSFAEHGAPRRARRRSTRSKQRRRLAAEPLTPPVARLDAAALEREADDASAGTSASGSRPRRASSARRGSRVSSSKCASAGGR